MKVYIVVYIYIVYCMRLYVLLTHNNSNNKDDDGDRISQSLLRTWGITSAQHRRAILRMAQICRWVW